MPGLNFVYGGDEVIGYPLSSGQHLIQSKTAFMNVGSVIVSFFSCSVVHGAVSPSKFGWICGDQHGVRRAEADTIACAQALSSNPG